MRTFSAKVQLILAFCLVAPLAGRVSAEPWARFRGPNGTGVSADRDIPVHWTEKDGVLWKTAIPGVGNSSPVIWGTRVFLQSSAQAGKERLLLCLDAIDGKLLWSRSVPASVTRIHRKNTLASSTPATDGERVYALFWDGADLALYAYDFQGNLLWKRGLGSYTSQHGAGASPVIYGEKVFLLNDQDGSSQVLALDAKTGKLAWQAPRKAFRACYSTPFLLEEAGHAPQLIVASTAGITSYQPQSGSENWHYTWNFSGMALRTVGSPLSGQGLIIANSGDGSGARHALAVKAGAAENGSKVSLVWEQTRTLPYVPTMLVWGDYLYFVNDSGLAGCCSLKTGEQVWAERLAGDVTASPVLIDGKIYSINEDGAVHVFPAEPTFKLLAKNSIGEPVRATPAVADHRLFVRGKNHLFCIGKPLKSEIRNPKSDTNSK